MKLFKEFIHLIGAMFVALLHPENRSEWRFAWAYLVFPFSVFLLGVFGGIILMWIFPSPIDFLITVFWIFYVWVCEPYMYYIEGDGFKIWDGWIEKR